MRNGHLNVLLPPLADGAAYPALIAAMIAELRRAGLALDAAWFSPHFELRLPLVGRPL